MAEIPPLGSGMQLPRYDAGALPPSPLAHPVRPPDDRTEGTANAALVLALIPTVVSNVVGIGLAISVLNKPYGGRFNGRGKAIAAIVLALVWLAITVLLFLLPAIVDGERNEAGELTSGGRVLSASLRTGDCLETMALGEVQQYVDVVPCSELHEAEVYLTFDLEHGPWPGEEDVIRFADAGCLEAFAAWAGTAYETSTIEIAYFYPVRISWSEDRGVTCVAMTAEPRTGSLAGSGL